MTKSNDFEVHEIGTTQELKLCRELVQEMAQVSKQYGRGIFPANVANKLDNLIAFYGRVVENERYENGI
jgi:hypothetical protein